MTDIAYLKKKGATPEKLKAKFTSKNRSEGIKKLMELQEGRLLTSIRRNFDDSRLYWTANKIINSSLRNMKYVQARELLENKTYIEPDKTTMIDVFRNWGLHMMLQPKRNTDGSMIVGPGNVPMLELNIPLFDTVFVPLVLAYRSIRWAKLFTERNVYPLYKYSPAHSTTKAAAQCDVITSVMQRQAQDMGYINHTKQSILQMLDYGMAIRMPDSAWFREEYDTTENGKTITRTQREGIRWTLPPPERTIVDYSYPLSSINTDTGCSYLGYWDLKRYGEVKSNKNFWNIDELSFGGTYGLFHSSAWNSYQELFPCNLRFPMCSENTDINSIDRTDRAFLYTTGAEADAATTVAVLFTKLIPEEYDLFDYDKPCWIRTVFGDTSTALYCEPIPYTPGACYLYDYDSNRGITNSLTIQLSPFQQLFGNFLTQHFISIRNNLPRIVFYNEDIVQQEHVERIIAQKARLYQELIFLPFSKQQQSFQQQQQTEAFLPLIFPQANTSELANTLRLTLDIMERMLGFPAQEVGATASHEQTAKEMLVLQSNTNVRVQLTGSGVDDAENAVKRSNYEGWVNYGSDSVTATVVGDDPKKIKALEDLGFEVEKGSSNRNNTYGVKGSKKLLTVSDFASSQEGQTRAQDPKVAIAMMQVLSVALGNPVIFQTLGIEQVVQLLNDVMVWSGLPDDFRFHADPSKTPDAQREALIKGIEAAKGEIMQQAGQAMQQQLVQLATSLKQELVEPMKAVVAKTGQRFQQIDAVNAQQTQAIQQLAAAMDRIINGISPANVNGTPAPAPPEMADVGGIPVDQGPPEEPGPPVGPAPVEAFPQ